MATLCQFPYGLLSNRASLAIAPTKQRPPDDGWPLLFAGIAELSEAFRVHSEVLAWQCVRLLPLHRQERFFVTHPVRDKSRWQRLRRHHFL